ncbi:cytochrome P450 4B1-like [Bolinopsis microptera]|uniref:cytochrome P450 4B1-like n=1 Tax=Bolinopsis microptera TaxID=2820187 RepID=UPI0030791193
MSQYIYFWKLFRNKNKHISSTSRTAQQDWCPYILLLQGVLLIWALRQLFLIFWKYCTHNGYIESVVPGPWVWPIFGHIPTAVPIRPAGLQRFHEWTKRFPVMVKYMVSSFIPITYVHHPVPIRELLSLNLPKERKYVYRFLEAYTGEGLIVASQPKWGKHRRLINKAFHRKALNSYRHKIVDSCKAFTDKLEGMDGAEVNATHECGMLALDTLLSCTFSLQAAWQHDPKVDRFVKIVSECVSILTRRIYNPIWYLDWIFFRLPAGRKFLELVKEAREFSQQIIEKSNAESPQDNIISHVLSAPDSITTLDLANEVTTILFAGHDTTAHAMAFSLVLLAQHKDCWKRCRDEVLNSSVDLDDCTENLQDIFPYVNQCIKETLRLYPSVPIIAKRTDRPLSICGIDFPAQTWFAINFYSLHRHQDYWKDPLKFDPERFNEINIKNITPFTYLPFSSGPRNCIGSKFALMEMMTALVQVVRTFDDIECIKFGEVYSDVVLRPEEIKLKFIKR